MPVIPLPRHCPADNKRALEKVISIRISAITIKNYVIEISFLPFLYAVADVRRFTAKTNIHFKH
jgi:hypothetical protein